MTLLHNERARLTAMRLNSIVGAAVAVIKSDPQAVCRLAPEHA